MKTTILFIIIAFLSCKIHSQQDRVWAVSDSCSVVFSSSGPVVIPNSTASATAINTTTLCAEDGTLLLYYDAFSLKNRFHKPIPGLPDNGWLQGYQMSILLPDLIKKELVHLFYVGDVSGMPLYHAIIDIHANNDSGAIISGPSIIYTPSQGAGPQVSQGLSAVPDMNNQYWWLIAQEAYGSRFIKFKVGNGHIEESFIQDVNFGISFSYQILSSFSNIGNKYVFTLSSISGDHGILVEQDFDRCSGNFSNINIIDSLSTYIGYGIPTFSRNDSLLYISGAYINMTSTFKFYQYDLFSSNISSSKRTLIDTVVTGSRWFLCSRLAPDGKIYIGEPAHDISFPSPGTCPDTGYYAVVHNPNVYGPGCNFEDKFLMMPGVFYGDIPNMPLYTTPPLTAQQAGCGYDSVTLTLGDSIRLGSPDTSMGKCTFAWFPSTGLNDPNTAQPWCKPTVSGWYHLVVNDTTLSSPCAQTEDSVYVQVNAVGLEADLNRNDAWKVYPNPASTMVHFAGNEHDPDATIVLMDLVGHVLVQVQATVPLVTLDVSGLPAGMYLYRVESPANGVKTGQIILIREER